MEDRTSQNALILAASTGYFIELFLVLFSVLLFLFLLIYMQKDDESDEKNETVEYQEESINQEDEKADERESKVVQLDATHEQEEPCLQVQIKEVREEDAMVVVDKSDKQDAEECLPMIIQLTEKNEEEKTASEISQLYEVHRVKETEHQNVGVSQFQDVSTRNVSADINGPDSTKFDPKEDTSKENQVGNARSNTISLGLFVNPECQSAFQQIFEGSVRYIIYKIDSNEIVVEMKKSDKDIGVNVDQYEDNSKQAYKFFFNDLKGETHEFTDCVYAVFDFKFMSSRPGTGSKIHKILFIQFCSDRALTKRKMLHALSASAIQSTLGSETLFQLQVSEESQLSHEQIFKKLYEKFHDN